MALKCDWCSRKFEGRNHGNLWHTYCSEKCQSEASAEKKKKEGR